MKKLGILIALVLSGMAFSFAQPQDVEKVGRRMKEVQEYKMKYLAQEMELSESQKKKFFETYEEMASQKHECYKEAIKLDHALKHDPLATDADYQNVTRAFDEANARWAETEKIYSEKFSEFLSPKQIYKMKAAETNFRAKFDEMKHNRKKQQYKKSNDK